MPYSFVWLYLMKCVFTCSIFVNSSTKRFLSVLGVFGKYFVWKIWKFQKKPVLPCFGGSVAGMSSREPQSRLRGSFLATCSRVEGPVARLLRDFRGSARDSLAGRPSSREKHLENFFKIFSLSVLVAWLGDLLATHFSREKHVFGKNRGSF